jgi:two-component system osmolarity sensor histidine kinase EnvZ
MKLPWIRAPRSLFGRNLLLIAALIITAELCFGILFKQLVQEPRATRMIDITQMHIGALHAALMLIAPQQRPVYLDQLNANDPKQVTINRLTALNDAPVQFEQPKRRNVTRFMRHLEEQLQPHGYRLGWQEKPEQRLWIGTRIDDSMYWYGVDADAFVGKASGLFFAFAIGSGLLALLGAYLIQRRINRPLYTLANAVAEISRGKMRPLPLDSLPLEIAQLAASFNQMSGELEATERERALMLAGVSHDLRTPLAKLRLATEILSDHCEPELIEGMVRNIASADAIIGQFIDFARLGGDEAIQPCDINELVTDIARTSGQTALKLQLTALPLYPCRVLALRRAIGNLIENALHYGAKDEGSIVSVTVCTTFSDETIFISIQDEGHGIPPEHMARLRQPFTRLEEARNGRAGAGLGLAIVERIARLHHGELVLTNRAGGGLDATLLLPAAS